LFDPQGVEVYRFYGEEQCLIKLIFTSRKDYWLPVPFWWELALGEELLGLLREIQIAL